MKNCKLLQSVILLILAVLTVFAVTAAAAEYTADDGMSFEIVTSKQEYGVNEEVQIILLAKNYNENMKLANITWEATVPGDEELTFLSGELSGSQKVEVGERAAINLRLMKIVETEKPPVDDPNPTTPTTPTNPTQPTQPGENEESDGNATALVIILIVVGLAAIAVVVYLILKKRGIISCFVILLVLSLLLPCLPIMDVSAVELNLGDVAPVQDNELYASVKFTVDGKEYEATATITYEMEKQTETVVEAMRSDMSELEWDTYRTPPVLPTVGQHPRLRFTEKDIPDIIANLESDECATMAQEFYTYLGMDFNGTFSSLNATEEAEGRTNYNAKNFLSIRCKALYYALYKNSDDQEKATMALYYGKTAVRAIQRAMDTIKFAGDYDIYTRGDFQHGAAEVYDWCYDLLTYEDKQNIAAKIQKISAASESGWPVEIGPAVVSHLAGDLIQSNWMAIAIAMYDEYPTFYEYIGGAYFEVFVPPRNVWYVSGTHHQGASYGVAGRANCDMVAQNLIYKMTGGDNDYDGDGKEDGVYPLDPIAGMIGYQHLYSMRPDGQLFREGDVWEENQTDEDTIWDAGAGAIRGLANLYKNGHYRRLAHELSGGMAFTGESVIGGLIYHDPDVQAESYYNLPYTRYFPMPSASMIARTGWNMGTASNDVIVKMQLTPVYLNNHQHHDAGAFQVYYKGILASESGYYVLYNTQHDAYYNKTSTAHNTLAITSISNRYGQQINGYVADWGHVGKQDTVNTVVGEEFGPNVNKPEYSYLAGDIAGSYDANVQEAVRSMLFLNLELDGNNEYPGAFIVFDQIKTSEVGSKKSFLLHMQSEPEIDGNVIIIKNTEDDYNGKLTDQVLYVGTASKADENYTITSIGGPGREFVVGNHNYAHSDSITSDLCQEQGWGRVEISTTAKEVDQTDYLLNVMYVSNADGSTKVVPAKLVYDGQGVLMGAQLMNHVAMFNMDGNNRISKDVSFVIPENEGYETFKVNVAGLKAGTWTIAVNGKSVGTQVASEDGGMIYFEAPAGTIKLYYHSADSNKTFDETPNTDVEPIGMMINNFYYYTEAHPEQSGEEYLVPVSVVFSALNGKGKWDPDHTEYTADLLGKVYTFKQSSVKIDGQEIPFNKIKLSNGDLLLDASTLRQIVAGEGTIYYDKYINMIRVNVVVESAVPDMPEGILEEFPNAVQVEALVDKGYSTLPMANALDGDPSTRWTTQESGAKISEGIFDFGKVVPLTDVMIKFWTETNLYSDYVFDIYASVNGSEYLLIQENARSGEVAYATYADTWVKFMLNCEARYIKFVGHGRFTYGTSGKPTSTKNNTWFIPAEIVFLQKELIDPDGAEMVGNRLQAEAECFHTTNGTVVSNPDAMSKEEVALPLGSKNNPGKVSAADAQMYAYLIPKIDAPHDIWVRVNTAKVTSGDTLWVNIEGVTGDQYYAENVMQGRTNSAGYRWIKLGQYEAQTALTKLTAGQKYKISVISGCEGLVVDCFMISSDPSYVPIESCYDKQTDTKGELTVDAKDAIFDYSAVTPSGSGAKLQKVSADGTVSQAYKDFVLNSKNLPGDICLDIRTNTSGVFTVYATLKADSLSKDQFFYAVSLNDSSYRYTLYDLSEQVAGYKAGETVTVKLAELEALASNSIFVRIKACTEGVTVNTISTTCVLPTGVYATTDGKLTVQAENATLSKPGEENVIISKGAYYTGETVKVLDSATASGGKSVKFTQTYTGYNKMITYTNEPNPHISFRVMPDQPGEYYIWAKVYAPKDTFIYVFIEGGNDTYYWRQPLTNETYSSEAGEYIWVRLYHEWWSAREPKWEHHYSWVARGMYTISLRGAYSSVEVDEIFISNDINDAPHNHLFSTEWSADDTHHWNMPSCGCTDIPPRYYAPHSYEDHTDRYCDTCNYENPEYAPHSYEEGFCTICGGLEPFKTTNGKLTMEAESLMLAPDGTENFIPGYTGSVAKIVETPYATGGLAVQFPRTNTAWNNMLTAGKTPIPHISALVTPDVSGQYYIWLKVYAPENSSGSSVYAYIDGGKDTYYWRRPLCLDGTSMKESDYFWVPITDEYWSLAENKGTHTYNWTAGETYMLRFRGFVSGVRIDQVYVTNDPNDIPHEHIYHVSWDKDATHHWHNAICGCEGLVADKTEHTFTDEWVKNGEYHWNECLCGAQTNKVKHTYVDGICSVCGTPKPFESKDGKVSIQAEDGLLQQVGQENYLLTGSWLTSPPYAIRDNAYASGGKTIRAQIGSTAWYGLQTFASTNSGKDPSAHATYNIRASATGQHYIWVKVYAPNTWGYGSGDAAYFFVGDDNGTDKYFWRQPFFKADGSYSDTESDFYWVRVYQQYDGTTQVGKDKVYNWTAGEVYSLRLRTYATGVQIDEIYVTTDPDDPYVKNHEHAYSDKWTNDDTHHWHAATCGHDFKVSEKAEHTYSGEMDASCDVCGYIRELHYHSFKPVWIKDDNYHWQECDCGAVQNKEKHTYVNLICSVCGVRDTFKMNNGYALIEAEDGLLQEIGKENYLTGGTWDTVPPFAVTDNASASGGKTLTALQGSASWYGLQTYSKTHNGEDPSAHATYTVQASETGEHYIWLKVYAPNNWGQGSGDAVYSFISDDNGTDTYFWRQPLKNTDGTYSDNASDFYWVRVYQQHNGTTQNGKDKVYTWTAGETYTLRFRVYSENVQIDQILVTTSDKTPDAILGA